MKKDREMTEGKRKRFLYLYLQGVSPFYKGDPRVPD